MCCKQKEQQVQKLGAGQEFGWIRELAESPWVRNPVFIGAEVQECNNTLGQRDWDQVHWACGQLWFHPISTIILAAWTGSFLPLTDDGGDVPCH